MAKSTIQKLIIALNFSRTKGKDLMSRAHTVYTNLGGASAIFTSLPVPLPILKQDLDNLAASTAAAVDGGTRDIAQRDKDRRILEHDLQLEAAYVLKVADGDPAIITASGFVPAPPRVHAAPQPLEQPIIDSIDQGVSGQLLVSVSPRRGAKNYQVQYAPLVNGVPGTWKVVSIPVARKPLAIDSLTPGTTYAFQVRAYGPLGYTDFSDSATRMVI